MPPTGDGVSPDRTRTGRETGSAAGGPGPAPRRGPRTGTLGVGVPDALRRQAEQLAQRGRGSKGARIRSISGRSASTDDESGRQVKWIVALSRPVAGLSQSRSAATVRISVTRVSGASRPRIAESPASAAGASARAMNHSLWSSSPALGTWSIRKWGSRSVPRPGTPRWTVHASGDIPGIGWTSVVARRASRRTAGKSLGEPSPEPRPPLHPDLVEGGPPPVREQAHGGSAAMTSSNPSRA